METQGDPKNPPKFACINCDYFTDHKNDYIKHCQTIKHRVSKMETQGDPESPKPTYKCKACSKFFYSFSGLCKHEKKCAEHQEVPKNDDITAKFFDYLKHRDEKEEEFKKMVVDLCKTMQITQPQANVIQNNVTNNNNIQQNNNTFNLNLFLNETCKDAMNLSDFIKGVKVSIDDIEHIGKVGYVDGLSDIIIKNLNELGVEKRPIHCTDAKRQIVYVKEDNKWEKEDENMTRLKKMVCGVQHANFVTLKKWREMYPSCLTANSIYTDTYNTMSQELMGGDCNKVSLATKEQKIISKVARGMIIDKTSVIRV